MVLALKLLKFEVIFKLLLFIKLYLEYRISGSKYLDLGKFKSNNIDVVFQDEKSMIKKPVIEILKNKLSGNVAVSPFLGKIKIIEDTKNRSNTY